MHTPVFRIITVNVQCFVYYIYVHVLLIAKYLEMFIFSSPEHEVLMVSYCDQSMSVVRVRRSSSTICFKSYLLLNPWANVIQTS